MIGEGGATPFSESDNVANYAAIAPVKKFPESEVSKIITFLNEQKKGYYFMMQKGEIIRVVHI